MYAKQRLALPPAACATKKLVNGSSAEPTPHKTCRRKANFGARQNLPFCQRPEKDQKCLNEQIVISMNEFIW